jgi:hypothetical protein
VTPLVQIVRGFLDKERCDYYADRMKESQSMIRDFQCPRSWSQKDLNPELLEDSLEKMEEYTGLRLSPTFDYCRIYSVGERLRQHTDSPFCEFSATICLRNEDSPWEFHWSYDSEQGAYAMEQGDAILYAGRQVKHWRLKNHGVVYQAFIHYVDLDGPHANLSKENGNEPIR